MVPRREVHKLSHSCFTSLRGRLVGTPRDCDDALQIIPGDQNKACTFCLTGDPTHGSLSSLSQESAGKRLRQGNIKGTRQGGKRRGKRKKILNSGNEPKDVLKRKELAFFRGQKRTGF